MKGKEQIVKKGKKEESPHYIGHRDRLKKKLLKDPKALADYEVLEVLLYYVFPRKDVKEQAKTLLNLMGSIRGVVLSDNIDRAKIESVSKSCVPLFVAVREIFIRASLEKVKKYKVISSSSQVVEYYKNIFFNMKHEQVRIMFLNSKNMLISEEVFQEGTINQTTIYPRSIIQKALEVGAAAIIMVHNHPSGDPEPSRQDIIMTRSIQDISKKLDLILLDHLIIGKDTVFSMKAHSLI